MKKEMLINVLQPEECRIAIVENGVLEELYVERSSQESYVGNIYKGRIVNIEPSIQAAFVDFGIGRNGFLHVSDVDPAYYKHLLTKEQLADYEAELDREYTGGSGGAKTRDRDRPRPERGDRPRGDRPERRPREMTSFLEPQPPARPADGEDVVEFASGLVEGEQTMIEPVTPDVDAWADETEAPPPPPKPQPRREPPRRHVPAPPAVEDSDFGEGIVEAAYTPPPLPLNEDDIPMAEPVAELDEVPPPLPDSFEPIDVDPPAEADSKVGRGRSRRAKPKAEEETAAPEATDDEAKAKPRARKPRKKVEGDDDTPDAPPKVMGGAEHRTSPPDDEPEIKPFFENDDFDINAPNDRFSDEAPAAETPAEVSGFADAPEGAEAPPREKREPRGRGRGRDRDRGERGERPEREERPNPVEREREPEAPVVGRGFNDDFEDARPARPERDRDRGRGGPRSRDRDRPGDRDRRPSGGGFKGGPRTGPGGPKQGRDRGLPKPSIEKIFKRGQEVIVQVIKEGIGTKGPTLSTFVSIAGRYLVLMPSLGRVGVSRKIEDHDARKRLREIMSTLTPPKGVGFIVRTAAVDRDKQELQNDLAYLLRLWQVVVRRVKKVQAPVEIYRESDLITRTIRDTFTSDIDTIWVDESTAFAHASDFLQIVMPKFADRIRHFDETVPLFHKYGVDDEIAKINQKRIEMPLGGSLVIEQTEALVAIDVNSGNFRADNNAEETAFQMNLHAAREIARQLRLRDLGGVIVNDFIDMRSETHRRKVEDALRDAMRRDRARTKILRISQFGLIEMTRQRIRPSLKRSIFSDCAHCRGTGFVKTSESLSIEIMRLLHLAAHRAPTISAVEVSVHTDVASHLLNKKRREMAALEERAGMTIQINGVAGVSPEMSLFRCQDQNGNEVRLLPPAPLQRIGGGGRGPRPDRGDRGDRGGDRHERGERRHHTPRD